MSDFHVPRGLDPHRQARTWLDSTYRGLVELASPEPVAESFGTWHFACRARCQPGYPETPMLAATVVVPKDGSVPFHPAANDPWGDVEEFIRSRSPRTAEVQARKLNSRGCAVAVGSAVAGSPSSPLPWSPSHEAPGWWDILLRRYFPEAEVLECADWEAVIAAAQAPGPGTQGVVWLRREIKGLEATGHLLFVHNNKGNVVLLDGMSSGLGRMETEGVRGLTVARCRPAGSPWAPPAPPWQRPADGLAAAVAKAEAWLERTYREPVVLVAPGPDDERERGWLFACNTTAFLDHHDVNHAMLDAALVVPKSAAEPFGLPNSTPWEWFDAWNRAEEDSAPPRTGSLASGHAEGAGPAGLRVRTPRVGLAAHRAVRHARRGARAHLGTPYRHQGAGDRGADPHRGADRDGKRDHRRFGAPGDRPERPRGLEPAPHPLPLILLPAPAKAPDR